MSFPNLYTAATTSFSSNGVGVLSDAISCVVSEERNGLFELEMTYPADGVHYSDIANDAIIRAQASEKAGLQPFRIYKISRPINGIVTVSARHVRYQLASVPVSPFTASSAAAALDGLKSHAAASCPFSFWTDVTTAGTFTVSVPASLSSLLGGQNGSIIDTYGGEFEFDGYQVKLWKSRGEDNGVKILYGKNLTDCKQEEYISNLCTGVYPYWADSNGGYVELPEKVIVLQTSYSYPRIQPLDLSQDFQTAPTEAQLRTVAQEYLTSTDLTTPTVSIDVSFAQIWQTDEYKSDPLYQQIAGMEKLGLCDTVTVQYAKLGVNCKAKITAYEYDSILERYNKMTVGSIGSSLADTIAEAKLAAAAAQTQSQVGTEIRKGQKYLQDLICGATGGHVVINFGNDGTTAEILIMDTTDKNTAVKVLRINEGGIGFSTSGYNGPFNAAIGLDGKISAQWIATWSLTANIITAGLLQSKDGSTFFDLDNNLLGVQLGDFRVCLRGSNGALLVQHKNSSGDWDEIGSFFGFSHDGTPTSEVAADTYQIGAYSNSMGSVGHDTSGNTVISSQKNIAIQSDMDNTSQYNILLMQTDTSGQGTIALARANYNITNDVLYADKDKTRLAHGSGTGLVLDSDGAHIGQNGYSVCFGVDSSGHFTVGGSQTWSGKSAVGGLNFIDGLFTGSDVSTALNGSISLGNGHTMTFTNGILTGYS